MHLLLTNDDGIASPFLAQLAAICKARGHRVTVCAPAQNQSTASHRYTMHEAIRVSPAEADGADGAWAVSGTPVDCVRIALRKLCPDADLVLSGPNLGWNTGWPIHASGTVGAAREAVLSGLPGIALSAETATPEDTLRRFLVWCLDFAESLPHAAHALHGVWNLNAPCVPSAQLRAPCFAPLERRIYADDYDAQPQPDGSVLFRMRGLAQPAPQPGSDLHLLHAGHITVTLLPADGASALPAHLLPPLAGL